MLRAREQTMKIRFLLLALAEKTACPCFPPLTLSLPLSLSFSFSFSLATLKRACGLSLVGALFVSFHLLVYLFAEACAGARLARPGQAAAAKVRQGQKGRPQLAGWLAGHCGPHTGARETAHERLRGALVSLALSHWPLGAPVEIPATGWRRRCVSDVAEGSGRAAV